MSASVARTSKRLGRVRPVVVAALVLLVLTVPALVPSIITPTILSPQLGNRDSHLLGQAADDYLAMKAKNNPTFGRFLKNTEADLSARGWTKPHGGALVLIRQADAPQAGALSRFIRQVLGSGVTAQELDASTGSGEIIFSSWDDGDNNTWEGAIWIQDYTSGDTFSFQTQFDYSASMDGVTPPTTTWLGGLEWRDRDGFTREASLHEKPEGFFASAAGAVCPALAAQASNNLSCSNNGRALVNACMKQGFTKVAENAGWLLAGAAAAGVFASPGVITAPVAFLGTLGLTGGGVLLDGYLNEFNRFMTRCSR